MTTELITLGTAGGPSPVAGRFGIATALVVDGDVYLVDAGRGAVSQYARAGLPLDRLRAVFVTHLHADHTADLFNLFMLGSDVSPVEANGIHQSVRVIGPPAPPDLFPPIEDPYGRTDPVPGLLDLFAHSYDANAYTLNNWRLGGSPDLRKIIEVEEIALSSEVVDACAGFDVPTMEPIRVYDDDRIQVDAVLVPHLRYSFAFRIETTDGVVVFSGDTGPSPDLATFARGANVLVHEVMDIDMLAATGMPEFLRGIFLRAHTDVAEVGAIATGAGVETLLLNHLIPADPEREAIDRWRGRVGDAFDGAISIPDDLERLSISR